MTGGINPKNVKPGDMVTLSRGNSTARGAVTHVQDFLHLEELGRYRVKGLGDGTRTGGYTEWTLTAHMPAPEPEPEWEPGDMAAVTARGWVNAWSVRTATNDGWASHDNTDDVRRDDEVEAVRPLVVIDPATVDVEALTKVGDEAYLTDQSEFRHDGIQAAILAALAHLGIEVPR